MNHRKLKFAYSIPDGADTLGISTRKLYDEISAGRILTFKIGKRRLVSEDSLHAYIKDREMESAG